MSADLQQKFSFGLLKRVLSYANPYRKMFAFAAFIAIVFAFVSPVRAMLTQYTLDNFIVHPVGYISNGVKPDKEMLLTMTLIMIGVLLFETLLQFLNEYLAGWLGQTIIKDMRTKLFNHINHLHLQYFDKTPIGTLVTRVISDMEAISDIFSEGLLVILGDFLKLIVIISVMFYTNWKLSLISLSVFPLLIAGANMFKNGVNKSFNEVRTQIARLNSFVQEHITGMSVVQIFNREEEEMKKFREINASHRKANIRSIWYYSVFFPFIEILSSVSIGLIVWWGGRGVFDNAFSIGQLVAFIMYINMLFRPIRLIADRFNTLQMGIVASERVFRVMDTKGGVMDNGKCLMANGNTSTINPVGNISNGVNHQPLAIEFKNVWFSYDAPDSLVPRPSSLVHSPNWVLKNISFEAKQGETVALVGATGSGKSSIASLINRFYEYTKGEILIDGINIREYELNSLRKNIGIVLQDVFLYSDTIANNISLHPSHSLTLSPSHSLFSESEKVRMKESEREKVVEAAKIIGAHDFIMRLPGNYDYNVMERGATLSVGQRQLISFIRAYLYNPAILILDEATSSIDTESEMLIQRATEALLGRKEYGVRGSEQEKHTAVSASQLPTPNSRTSIVIAHRLATIQRADKIIVLDKGEIIESGTHRQLLELNKHYRKLYELQFMKEIVA
ncbi:MAG: ABC transporter ATP-binding protein [Bacteroidetes bacterium]|nr:ABC transporter ATP-binding protein [Bacteroidota bacterium]